MKILTCNVRIAIAKDLNNQWQFRKDLCARIIKSQNPDIICFQELWKNQFNDLAEVFSDFATYGIAEDTTSHHQVNCIFYQKNKFAVISSSGYWLSEKPHIAGTKSWDSNCVRFANWVHLRDKTSGGEFRVVNTHLDHLGQTARENQAKIIVEESSAFAMEFPQILTGDMNCDVNNKAIHIFKDGGWVDTFSLVHGPKDPGNTYHGFIGPKYIVPENDMTKGKMDWIFIRGNCKAIEAAVIREEENGRFPSDHYFVSATVNL